MPTATAFASTAREIEDNEMTFSKADRADYGPDYGHCEARIEDIAAAWTVVFAMLLTYAIGVLV